MQVDFCINDANLYFLRIIYLSKTTIHNGFQPQLTSLFHNPIFILSKNRNFYDIHHLKEQI
ncbi:hypothetical protein Hanom_Chr01g00050931 [Helianthus anomalus]